MTEALGGAAEAGAYTCEFRWRCADGNYRIFLDQGVISANADGRPPEILGTLLDVTERRQLEDRLMQSQRLDAIGKLTGGLAHDFNNLLAAILSGLGLLERRAKLDGDARQIVEMTRHAARQGADLVNRMLAFSRRQQAAARPPCRLTTLADTMNGLVAPVLGGLVRFEWQVDDAVWPAHVDAGQLELALMNLVFNARDAMPSGGTITIRADNRSVPTRHRRPAGRRLCPHRGEGHRRRHPARAPVQGDRAVLHHQVGRQGHRSRPQHRLRLRQAVRRHAQDRQRRRARHVDGAVAAAVQQRCRRHGSGGPARRNEPVEFGDTLPSILLVDDSSQSAGTDRASRCATTASTSPSPAAAPRRWP